MNCVVDEKAPDNNASVVSNIYLEGGKIKRQILSAKKLNLSLERFQEHKTFDEKIALKGYKYLSALKSLLKKSGVSLSSEYSTPITPITPLTPY